MKKGSSSGQRRILCPRSKPNIGHKNSTDEEDLLLFREIHKREKERIATLLQPVSEEFEPIHYNSAGNDPVLLYRIPSAKKVSGYEFLAGAGGNKNDYDWLKTPPATPLFPSLEMEAGAPDLQLQLQLHRETPILQPLSRFSSVNSEASKEGGNIGRISLSPNPKIPARSTAQPKSGGLNISILSAATKNPKGLISNLQGTTTTTTLTPSKVPIIQQESESKSKSKSNPNPNPNFPIGANLSRNNYMGTTDSKMKPQPRPGPRPTSRSSSSSSSPSSSSSSGLHVSPPPRVRTKFPAQIPGFSNQTPPNLKTDRSSSASHGRSSNPRRQSCSPSMARNRLEYYKQQEISERNLTTDDQKVTRSSSSSSSSTTTTQTANRGAQVVGSRMVDKVMNARKSSGAHVHHTTHLNLK